VRPGWAVLAAVGLGSAGADQCGSSSPAIPAPPHPAQQPDLCRFCWVNTH
jgi:hypothetical protein